MDAILQEARQAARALRRTPGFTLVAVLTLGLGIGATTGIFSVAKGVLLDPLPYPDPSRLTLIWSGLPRVGYERAPISGPELDDLRRRSDSFEALGSIWATSAALVEDGKPQALRLGMVTGNFLDTLGVPPALGRTFADADEGDGAAPVIVLGGRIWQESFGSDPDVLGRSVRVDGGWGFPGGTYTVVGVMPAGFTLAFPTDSGVPAHVDAFVPFGYDLAADSRSTWYLRTVGRLKKNATVAAANAEVAAIGERLVAEYNDYADGGRSFEAVPLHGDAVRTVRPAVIALLVGVSLLLLIACTNVANLLLVRATDRRREIALRTALGAPARRIALQLLAESLWLALLGGALGVVVAFVGLRLLPSVLPADAPPVGAPSLDGGVLAFSILLSALAGMLFGLAPVLASRGRRSLEGLKETGRGNVGSGGVRARSLLVVAEVAVSILLLIGASLTGRTFQRLIDVDPGFRSDSALSFRLNLPRDRYSGPVPLAQFAEQLEQRLTAIPGIAAAGAINQLPLDDLPNWSTSYRFRGAPENAGYEADARVITPGYGKAAGLKLVEGRFFDASDRLDTRSVAIVDETLAARTWPGQSAVGQEIGIAVWTGNAFEPGWAEVVGVVEHVRHHDLTRDGREQVWVPLAQGARNQMAVVVRGSVDPAGLVGPIRAAIAAIDPDLAASEFLPLGDYVDRARSRQRFTMSLAAVFAVVALVLAGVGLYGVVSWSVSRRTREIGVRMALGAERGRIHGLVVGQGLKLALAGVAVGLIGSALLVRTIEGLLYGVRPFDAVSFVIVPLTLATVALLACWLPARRATRVDPVHALRSE